VNKEYTLKWLTRKLKSTNEIFIASLFDSKDVLHLHFMTASKIESEQENTKRFEAGYLSLTRDPVIDFGHDGHSY
jgi:hypothetical protein